jgi:hypothetical protein
MSDANYNDRWGRKVLNRTAESVRLHLYLSLDTLLMYKSCIRKYGENMAALIQGVPFKCNPNYNSIC